MSDPPGLTYTQKARAVRLSGFTDGPEMKETNELGNKESYPTPGVDT